MKKLIKLEQSADNPKELNLTLYGVVDDGHEYDPDTGNYLYRSTSAKYVQKELEKHPDAELINVHMHSKGGSVYEAMGIWAQLKQHPAKVVGTVDGVAMSAMSYIATACDKVRMYKNSIQMIHNASVLAYGDANFLRSTADDLDKMMEANRQSYLMKAGDKLTEEKLIELLDAETILTAQECLEIGLCDEIIDDTNLEDDVNKLKQKFDPDQSKDDLINQLKQEIEELKQAKMQPEPEQATEPEQIEEPEEPDADKGVNFFAAMANLIAEKGQNQC